MTLSHRSALLVGLALASTTPALAQGPLTPGGDPDPTFPSFYAWYDAGDGPGGAGVPNEGDPVSSWVDNTGNGRDLVRVDVDPTRQPTFRAGAAAGLPALEFDGDDYIWADSILEFGTVANPKTILAVVRVDAFSNGYVFDSSSTAGRNALFNGQNATPDTWHVYSGASPVTVGAAVVLDVWQVHSVVFDASFNEHFIDGVSVAQGSSIMSPMAGLILGSRFTVANFLVGHIAEFLFYDEVLSATDRAAVEGYLAGKYFSGPVGTSYCTPAIPNSTGFPGVMSATGSVSVATGDLTLTASSLPGGQFGYFLASETQGFFNPPGSSGFICLAGNIGRYNQPGNVIVGPEGSIPVDLTSIPVNPPVAVQPGDTWNFQCWYRDVGNTNNFTDGLTMTFL